MTWDLATAKARLGIGVSSEDANIQRYMDIALDAIENVLQRCLLRRISVHEIVLNVRGRTIALLRYPVEQINSITDPEGSGTVPDYRLDSLSGVIYFNEPVAYNQLEVVYRGGYDPLPADLEEAMWQAFEYLWAESSGLERIPGAGSGGVSRVTIQDFGSVTLDNALMGGSGPGMDRLVNAQLDWGWLLPWSHTLQFYRSEKGVGAGIA